MVKSLPELRAAVRLKPDDAAALTELGAALTERGEYRRAVVYLRAALRIAPENTRSLNQLAQALLGTGNPEEAAWCYERAVSLNPASVDVWQSLGTTYFQHLNRLDEAFNSFSHAIQLCPTDLQNYEWAARCLLNGMGAQALISRFQEMLPTGADMLRIRRGAGRALLETGRYEEALSVFDGIVGEFQDDAYSLRCLGQLYNGLRDTHSAWLYFERALNTGSEDRDVILSYLLHLARLGDWEGARDFYRSRTRLLPIHFQVPPLKELWHGQDIRNKTVRLIVGDIYYGDALQFVRFARAAKRMGATVIVQGPKRIRSLLRTVPGADTVVAPGDPVPPFDYSAAAFWTLFSLQIPFEEIVDPTPYIHSQAELREQWRCRFNNDLGFKIGIAWRGSDYHRPNPYACRSMPLENLRPLASIPGVRLYSLQTGPGLDELQRCSPPLPAIDLRPDFANTAAAMDELDLIVTVDTSIAHLAGALGRPTFVMLPYEACFRWMLDRDDTPWYRNMRLFRQSNPGSWSNVVTAVASAVRQMLT
jgi:tetratricopeptide (TPR) repeat protein